MRLVIGSGYLGLRVARRWHEAGDTVFASTRGPRAEELARAGLEPLILDVLAPRFPPLPPADTVLFAVGRDRAAGASMHDVHVRGLGAVLEALPATVRHVIYISTAGVWGQEQGEWVDERSECKPRREGGRACLAGESLLESASTPRRTALRLAGLYGRGRLPLRTRVEAGASIPGSADAYLNLIHVDDAAEVVRAAAASRGAGMARYGVADGSPVTRGEYVTRLAACLDVAVPPFEGGPLRGKRVRNRRMLRELGVTLEHQSSLAALRI